MSSQITLAALKDLPLVRAGDNLGDLISAGLQRAGITLLDADILVVAQKIVSKAEGRMVDLNTVTPGPAARQLAAEIHKDPRLVEVILSESKSVIRKKPGILIVEHRRGWIMANAGVDASNVASGQTEENVLLLPEDPEKSAAALKGALDRRHGCRCGVVIADSFGRPWRLGTTGVAIGAAGVPSLWDRRGEADLFGRALQVTQQAIADEVACAASLLQGGAAEGRPVVHLRGLEFDGSATAFDRPASDLIRDISEDLFR